MEGEQEPGKNSMATLGRWLQKVLMGHKYLLVGHTDRSTVHWILD